MAARLESLETAMIAAKPAAGDRKGDAEPYLAAMFIGYPAVKMERGEAEKTMRLYLSQLAGMPLFAIVAGCQVMMRRDSPFPPSVGQLYNACIAAAAPIRGEIRRLSAILAAEVYETKSAKDREKTIEDTQKLLASLRFDQPINMGGKP